MDGHPASAESLQEMAAKLFRGDEKVLAEVLRLLGPAIRALLVQKYRGVQSSEDIEDVLAVALYRLWQGRRLYQPAKASLQVWFYRIADNVVKDVLRSGWHKARRLETDLTLFPAADSRSVPPRNPADTAIPEPKAGRSRQVDDLREVIAALPEMQRRIIWADAQARADVAPSAVLTQELGLPATTIRVYRKRALDTIRAEMKKRGHAIP